jgi:hypothetical protein
MFHEMPGSLSRYSVKVHPVLPPTVEIVKIRRLNNIGTEGCPLAGTVTGGMHDEKSNDQTENE